MYIHVLLIYVDPTMCNRSTICRIVSGKAWSIAPPDNPLTPTSAHQPASHDLTIAWPLDSMSYSWTKLLPW